MNRFWQALSLSTITAILLAGCFSDKKATVTINLKSQKRAISDTAPSQIVSFKVYIKAPDMEKIEKEVNSSEESITLSLKPGSARMITLAAFDRDRFGAYAGTTTVDLAPGEKREVTIRMKNTIRFIGNANTQTESDSKLLNAWKINNKIILSLDIGGETPQLFEYSDTDILEKLSTKYADSATFNTSNDFPATAFQGRLYFAAGPDSYGMNSELWVYDGMSAPQQVADLNHDPEISSEPQGFMIFNDALYFFARNSSGSLALWRIRDTGAQPEEVALPEPGTYVSEYNFSYAATSTHLCFICEYNEDGSMFHSYDGEKIIRHDSCGQARLTMFNDTVYFSAYEFEASYSTLFQFDESGSTKAVIPESESFSNPEMCFVTGNSLYSIAAEQYEMTTLFRVDSGSVMELLYSTHSLEYSSGQTPYSDSSNIYLYATDMATSDQSLYRFNTINNDASSIFTNKENQGIFITGGTGNALFFYESQSQVPTPVYSLYYYNNSMPLGATNPKPVTLPGSSSPEMNDKIIQCGNSLIFNARHDTYGIEPYIYDHYE